MGIKLSEKITPTYAKQCTAFVDNDSLDNPGVEELPFTVRFKRRSREEQNAMKDEIKDKQDFIMELMERYSEEREGRWIFNRLALKEKEPEEYQKLVDIERDRHDTISPFAFEDWVDQGTFTEEDSTPDKHGGEFIKLTPANKQWLWDYGHGEIKAGVIRGWLASRNGAQAREGNSEPPLVA